MCSAQNDVRYVPIADMPFMAKEKPWDIARGNRMMMSAMIVLAFTNYGVFNTSVLTNRVCVIGLAIAERKINQFSEFNATRSLEQD